MGYRVVELVGGPLDGKRVMVDGPVAFFPIPRRVCAADFAPGREADTSLTVRCHVYRGPMWNPDRGHLAMQYEGEQAK